MRRPASKSYIWWSNSWVEQLKYHFTLFSCTVQLYRNEMSAALKVLSPFHFFSNSDTARNDALITKTCLYNFDPLKPHCYIVKLGFTGVYIIFLISA